jgi:hypothetical protein
LEALCGVNPFWVPAFAVIFFFFFLVKLGFSKGSVVVKKVFFFDNVCVSKDKIVLNIFKDEENN